MPTCVYVCVCSVVLRALKCESVSKLLLNCSREGLGGYMRCRANGGSISLPCRKPLSRMHTKYSFYVYICADAKGQTCTVFPLIAGTDQLPLIIVLFFAHLRCSSTTIASLFFFILPSFSHLYERGELDSPPSPFPLPLFICLPTQSGLILLVMVDIWDPAHSVWLFFGDIPRRDPMDSVMLSHPLHTCTHYCIHTNTWIFPLWTLSMSRSK